MDPNLPTAPSTMAVAADATDQAQALISTGPPAPTPLAADAAGLAGAQEPKQMLLADNSKGELLIDQGAAPVQASRKRAGTSECPADSSKQILPKAPNDFHARS